eukprot:1464888-Karenia_brevis.AAC.1
MDSAPANALADYNNQVPSISRLAAAALNEQTRNANNSRTNSGLNSSTDSNGNNNHNRHGNTDSYT